MRSVGGVSTSETWGSIADSIVAFGIFQAVVLDFSVFNFEQNAQQSKIDGELVRLTESLTKTRNRLIAAGIPLFVALHPIGNEVGPGETLPFRIPYPPGYPMYRMDPDRTMYPRIKAAIEASGARLIDAFPDFAAAQVPIGPLFGNDDFHFAPHGREIMAQAIVRGLEEVKPWAAKR